MIDARFLRASHAMIAVALLAVPFLPSDAEAQRRDEEPDPRPKVLILDPKPTDNTRLRFGEQTGDRLRDAIDLPDFLALDKDEIDLAARPYSYTIETLDCTIARQLADRLEAPLVFCGSYQTVNRMIEFTGSFWTVPGQEEFPIGTVRVEEGQSREAVAQVMEVFTQTTTRVAQISECDTQFAASAWEAAVAACTRALELAPNSVEARRRLAQSLTNLDRFDEALVHFDQVIAAEPYNTAMLDLAGWVAVQARKPQEARSYYQRYLEILPDSVPIRLYMATGIAQAGDDVGAMEMIERGLQRSPDNLDLHEQFGNFAFRAGARFREENPDDPRAPEMFRRAVPSYDRVFEARGREGQPEVARNAIAARINLRDFEGARAFGERALTVFPSDAQIRVRMAEANLNAGNIDRAVARMEEALAIDPQLPNARSQMAQWFIQAEDGERAAAWALRAAEAQELPGDAIAGMLMSPGWNARDTNRPFALLLLSAAKAVPGVSADLLSQVNFMHGFVLFADAFAKYQAASRGGVAVPPAVASELLPLFQEVLSSLQAGEGYRSRIGTDISQYVTITNQLIPYLEQRASAR